MPDLKTYQLALFALAIVMCIILYFIARRQRLAEVKESPATVEDYTAAHGEPIDVVALDATRTNELNAVILVYEHDLVIGGERVPREAITAATFNNAAVPYADNRYQIVIETTLAEKPVIHADAGCDATWASEALQQLSQYLPKQ